MVETNFRYNGETLPKCKQKSIDRYVKDGTSGGHFLDAVMANDLMRAFSHADSWSTELMPVIMAYVYNRIPMACHGSWDIVKNWQGMEHHRLQCEEEEAIQIAEEKLRAEEYEDES